MYKKRDADLLEQIKIILGDKLMHSVIPFSDTVRDSQKYGMPIEEYFEQKGVPKIGTAWNVVRAYTELTNEIIGIFLVLFRNMKIQIQKILNLF